MSDMNKPHLEDIATAVKKPIERLDARDKAEQAHEKQRSDEKERLSQRVSIAAIALTMLMSFLNFARAERDDFGKNLRVDASRAEREADAHWTLYHARRSGQATRAPRTTSREKSRPCRATIRDCASPSSTTSSTRLASRRSITRTARCSS